MINDCLNCSKLEQLSQELEDMRRRLVQVRGGKLAAEKEAATLRTALEWIDNHDQSHKDNGGDPYWFADNAPAVARRALYGS
jgi:hypothetical protein